MRDHDCFRPPGRPTREKQQCDLGLALSWLETRLDIALGLDEAFLNEIAKGDMVVAGNGVEEHNTVIANACLARSFEADFEGVGVEEEDGNLCGLDLIDELVGGICGVGTTKSGKQRGRGRD